MDAVAGEELGVALQVGPGLPQHLLELVEQRHLGVDRRGAGNSQGEATEAYEGPLGKEDALAAVAERGVTQRLACFTVDEKPLASRRA